jgi:hypothetical protein
VKLLDGWDYGFESCSGHGYLCVVLVVGCVLCQADHLFRGVLLGVFVSNSV